MGDSPALGPLGTLSHRVTLGQSKALILAKPVPSACSHMRVCSSLSDIVLWGRQERWQPLKNFFYSHSWLLLVKTT